MWSPQVIFDGIGSTIIAFILGAVSWNKLFRKSSRKASSDQQQTISNNQLLQPDYNLLLELSDEFSGTKMDNLFHLIENQILYWPTIDSFDQAILRFSSPHKKFRSSELETVKSFFLENLKRYFSFTSTTFHQIRTDHYKFYGGISELDIMTVHHGQYSKDLQEYNKRAEFVFRAWGDFLDTVRRVAPNFDWKS